MENSRRRQEIMYHLLKISFPTLQLHGGKGEVVDNRGRERAILSGMESCKIMRNAVSRHLRLCTF